MGMFSEVFAAEGTTYQEYNLENKIDGKDHSNSNRARYQLLFYRVHSTKPYMKIHAMLSWTCE